jgi:pectin methylesterase-like acyl-CoA thioesterase
MNARIDVIIALVALVAIAWAVPASANRIIVDQNAAGVPGVFTSVQQAINDSGTGAGDEVFVRAGVYREAISLNKDITLTCEGPHLVTLRNDSGSTIVVEIGRTVTIKGCTITGSGHGTSTLSRIDPPPLVRSDPPLT